MWTCPKCGKVNKDSATVCAAGCGARVAQEADLADLSAGSDLPGISSNVKVEYRYSPVDPAIASQAVAMGPLTEVHTPSDWAANPFDEYLEPGEHYLWLGRWQQPSSKALFKSSLYWTIPILIVAAIVCIICRLPWFYFSALLPIVVIPLGAALNINDTDYYYGITNQRVLFCHPLRKPPMFIGISHKLIAKAEPASRSNRQGKVKFYTFDHVTAFARDAYYKEPLDILTVHDNWIRGNGLVLRNAMRSGGRGSPAELRDLGFYKLDDPQRVCAIFFAAWKALTSA